MSKLRDLIYPIKKSLKAFERVLNSSQTPEFFLKNGGVSSKIINSRTLLESFNLAEILKTQLFDSKTKLFYTSSGCAGFTIAIDLTNNDDVYNRIASYFNFGVDQDFYVNILFENIGDNRFIYITVSSLIHGGAKVKDSSIPRIEQHVLLELRSKLIKFITQFNGDYAILTPLGLLNLYNRLFSSEEVSHYDKEQSLYDQVNSTNNNITNSGTLFLDNKQYNVFYTKQYPNITEQDYKNQFSEINKIFEDYGVDIIYSINFKTNKKLYEQNLIKFTSAFITIGEDHNDVFCKAVISLFRHGFNWYIYKNETGSFVQFINCLPYQYDYLIEPFTKNDSVYMTYPINKIIEILPKVEEVIDINEIDDNSNNEGSV